MKKTIVLSLRSDIPLPFDKHVMRRRRATEEAARGYREILIYTGGRLEDCFAQSAYRWRRHVFIQGKRDGSHWQTIPLGSIPLVLSSVSPVLNAWFPVEWIESGRAGFIPAPSFRGLHTPDAITQIEELYERVKRFEPQMHK